MFSFNSTHLCDILLYVGVHMLIIKYFVRKTRGYSDDNFRKGKKKKNKSEHIPITQCFLPHLILSQTRYGQGVPWPHLILSQTRYGQGVPWPHLILSQTRYGQGVPWPHLILSQTRYGQGVSWPHLILS